jgi:hypothetical protein
MRPPLLIVQLSILNPLTLTWCLQWQNNMALSNILLPWAYFVFLILLFHVGAWLSSHVHHHHLGFYLAPTFGLGPIYLVYTLRSRISPNRFHQLSKTKLGLSISPFLVIDDNPSQRYELKSYWVHVACPSIFTMCKGFRQVSWTWIGSISSTYICAKSLDWKLAHMHRKEVWESNVYQMMLRCKEWTFKAWYQSECTNNTILSTMVS